MPSASPSPIKRPSLNERTSSTHSLSSSGRQATAAHKVHRPHVVTRHSRNISHGKGLGKLGKVHSTANITTDHHQHQRKRSGGTTPPHSPRASIVKRNSSHVTLPKNTSYGNLRKNQSANALARNVSHPALKKVGLAPAPRPKSRDKRDGVFQLGDRSSDDEEQEEEEWEDSTTQSPELTRSNSKTSTPKRASTPNGEQIPQKALESYGVRADKTSSPPMPSLKKGNRSAPDLRRESGISPSQLPSDPALLHQNPRASRAPPAMSTVSAHVGPSQMMRSESSKSFTHISHADASSVNVTPASSGPASGPAALSVDGGVSHFLPAETPNTPLQNMADGSDEDSPSNFLSNYKPQPSESPESSKTIHKARLPQNPSRTQQRLELQRREMLRAVAATPTTPPATGLGLPMGSSTSLQSRQGSRNRNRSLAGELKAVKQDYGSAVKHLMVVRRFRSPIIDSMSRLKETNIVPAEVGVAAPGTTSKSRPQSRRGPSMANVNGHAKTGVSRSLEDGNSSPLASHPRTKTRGGRVHFQRQSSHDDIEVTPSQGSPDENQIDDQEGLPPEEALIRRIWDSREVYDAGEHLSTR
ncbi:hypothetical protein A1O3_02560 [Capronia epimyces CBS 606.96]|uniref:Uncharacterized protein n=1 Tax=Capronia epimyces CBS 606.96 TaxID=1182542 RepID=W9YAF7_9EURO|nr:uncharacterized protein A1O3_02560 [Capronia epimyces CBS 606.96]EXJ89493.1 hypothetical protein A1O3_02560 [Capronia epimyces CBS 606.96]